MAEKTLPCETSASDVSSQQRHEGEAPKRPPLPPKMPGHWRGDFPGVRPRFLRCTVELTFAVLCMVAFGQSSLRRKWTKECASEEDFARHKDLLASRINTIAVVVRSSPQREAPLTEPTEPLLPVRERSSSRLLPRS